MRIPLAVHTNAYSHEMVLGCDARHVAQESIVFEKVNSVWRVTNYQETNWGSLGDLPTQRPGGGL
jgi:hypothetical protein